MLAVLFFSIDKITFITCFIRNVQYMFKTCSIHTDGFPKLTAPLPPKVGLSSWQQLLFVFQIYFSNIVICVGTILHYWNI